MPIRRRLITFYAPKIVEPWFEVYCKKCMTSELVEDEAKAEWLDYKHQMKERYGITPLRPPIK